MIADDALHGDAEAFRAAVEMGALTEIPDAAVEARRAIEQRKAQEAADAKWWGEPEGRAHAIDQQLARSEQVAEKARKARLILGENPAYSEADIAAMSQSDLIKAVYEEDAGDPVEALDNDPHAAMQHLNDLARQELKTRWFNIDAHRRQAECARLGINYEKAVEVVKTHVRNGGVQANLPALPLVEDS